MRTDETPKEKVPARIFVREFGLAAFLIALFSFLNVFVYLPYTEDLQRSPFLTLLGLMPIGTVTSALAGYIGQRFEIHLDQQRTHYQWGRLFRTILSGPLFFTLIYGFLIYGGYQWAMPFVPGAGLLSPGLPQALLDQWLLAPLFFNPMNYFWGKMVIERQTYRQTLESARKDLFSYWAVAFVIWFPAIWLAMSFANPLATFFVLSAVGLAWGVIYTFLIHQEQITFLPFIKTRLAKMFPFKYLQSLYDQPWFGIFTLSTLYWLYVGLGARILFLLVPDFLLTTAVGIIGGLVWVGGLVYHRKQSASPPSEKSSRAEVRRNPTDSDTPQYLRRSGASTEVRPSHTSLRGAPKARRQSVKRRSAARSSGAERSARRSNLRTEIASTSLGMPSRIGSASATDGNDGLWRAEVRMKEGEGESGKERSTSFIQRRRDTFVEILNERQRHQEPPVTRRRLVDLIRQKPGFESVSKHDLHSDIKWDSRIKNHPLLKTQIKIKPKESTVRLRRHTLFEILEELKIQKKPPVTPQKLTSLIRERPGYESVKLAAVRDDLKRDSRLKGHPMVSIEKMVRPPQSDVLGRRAMLLSILDELWINHQPPVSPSELAGLAQQKPGYESITEETIYNDIDHDLWLRTHEKLQIRQLVLPEKSFIERRRAMLLTLANEHPSQVTPKELTRLIQEKPGFENVSFADVHRDLALDRHLKDHPRVVKRIRLATLRRRDVLFSILESVPSPINRAQLLERIQQMPGFEGVTEDQIIKDTNKGPELSIHPKLLARRRIQAGRPQVSVTPPTLSVTVNNQRFHVPAQGLIGSQPLNFRQLFNLLIDQKLIDYKSVLDIEERLVFINRQMQTEEGVDTVIKKLGSPVTSDETDRLHSFASVKDNDQIVITRIILERSQPRHPRPAPTTRSPSTFPPVLVQKRADVITISLIRPESGETQEGTRAEARTRPRQKVTIEVQIAWTREGKEWQILRGSELLVRVWKRKGKPTQIQFGAGKMMSIETPLDLRELLDRKGLYPDIDEETRGVAVVPDFSQKSEIKEKFRTQHMDITDPGQIAEALAEVYRDVTRVGEKTVKEKTRDKQAGPDETLSVAIEGGTLEIQLKPFPEELEVEIKGLPQGPFTFYELFYSLGKYFHYSKGRGVWRISKRLLEIHRGDKAYEWSKKEILQTGQELGPSSLVELGDVILLKGGKEKEKKRRRAEVRTADIAKNPYVQISVFEMKAILIRGLHREGKENLAQMIRYRLDDLPAVIQRRLILDSPSLAELEQWVTDGVHDYLEDELGHGVYLDGGERGFVRPLTKILYDWLVFKLTSPVRSLDLPLIKEIEENLSLIQEFMTDPQVKPWQFFSVTVQGPEVEAGAEKALKGIHRLITYHYEQVLLHAQELPPGMLLGDLQKIAEAAQHFALLLIALNGIQTDRFVPRRVQDEERSRGGGVQRHYFFSWKGKEYHLLVIARWRAAPGHQARFEFQILKPIQGRRRFGATPSDDELTSLRVDHSGREAALDLPDAVRNLYQSGGRHRFRIPALKPADLFSEFVKQLDRKLFFPASPKSLARAEIRPESRPLAVQSHWGSARAEVRRNPTDTDTPQYLRRSGASAEVRAGVHSLISEKRLRQAGLPDHGIQEPTGVFGITDVDRDKSTGTSRHPFPLLVRSNLTPKKKSVLPEDSNEIALGQPKTTQEAGSRSAEGRSALERPARSSRAGAGNDGILRGVTPGNNQVGLPAVPAVEKDRVHSLGQGFADNSEGTLPSSGVLQGWSFLVPPNQAQGSGRYNGLLQDGRNTLKQSGKFASLFSVSPKVTSSYGAVKNRRAEMRAEQSQLPWDLRESIELEPSLSPQQADQVREVLGRQPPEVFLVRSSLKKIRIGLSQKGWLWGSYPSSVEIIGNDLVLRLDLHKPDRPEKVADEIKKLLPTIRQKLKIYAPTPGALEAYQIHRLRHKPLDPAIALKWQGSGAREKLRVMIRKDYSNTLESMRSLVKDVLQWLIDNPNYPDWEALKKFQSEMGDATVTSVSVFEKRRREKPGRPVFVEIRFNKGTLWNYLQNARRLLESGEDGESYFFETVVSILIREAAGAEAVRSIVVSKYPVLNELKRLLPPFSGPQAKMNLKPEAGQEYVPHREKIQEGIAVGAAYEYYEGIYQQAGYDWGEEQGIYSPETVERLLKEGRIRSADRNPIPPLGNVPDRNFRILMEELKDKTSMALRTYISAGLDEMMARMFYYFLLVELAVKNFNNGEMPLELFQDLAFNHHKVPAELFLSPAREIFQPIQNLLEREKLPLPARAEVRPVRRRSTPPSLRPFGARAEVPSARMELRTPPHSPSAARAEVRGVEGEPGEKFGRDLNQFIQEALEEPGKRGPAKGFVLRFLRETVNLPQNGLGKIHSGTIASIENGDNALSLETLNKITHLQKAYDKNPKHWGRWKPDVRKILIQVFQITEVLSGEDTDQKIRIFVREGKLGELIQFFMERKRILRGQLGSWDRLFELIKHPEKFGKKGLKAILKEVTTRLVQIYTRSPDPEIPPQKLKQALEEAGENFLAKQVWEDEIVASPKAPPSKQSSSRRAKPTSLSRVPARLTPEDRFNVIIKSLQKLLEEKDKLEVFTPLEQTLETLRALNLSDWVDLPDESFEVIESSLAQLGGQLETKGANASTRERYQKLRKDLERIIGLRRRELEFRKQTPRAEVRKVETKIIHSQKAIDEARRRGLLHGLKTGEKKTLVIYGGLGSLPERFLREDYQEVREMFPNVEFIVVDKIRPDSNENRAKIRNRMKIVGLPWRPGKRYFDIQEFHRLGNGDGTVTLGGKKIRIDGVITAVPTYLHYEITERWAKQGVPVWVDKPLGMRDQVEDFRQLARAHPGTVMGVDFFMDSDAFIWFTKRFKHFLKMMGGEISRIEAEEVESWGLEPEFQTKFRRWLMNPKISGGGLAIDTTVHASVLVGGVLTRLGVSLDDIQIVDARLSRYRHPENYPKGHPYYKYRGKQAPGKEETYAWMKGHAGKIKILVHGGKGTDKVYYGIKLIGKNQVEVEIFVGTETHEPYVRVTKPDGQTVVYRFEGSGVGYGRTFMDFLLLIYGSKKFTGENLSRRLAATSGSIAVVDRLLKVFEAKHGKRIPVHRFGTSPDVPEELSGKVFDRIPPRAGKQALWDAAGPDLKIRAEARTDRQEEIPISKIDLGYAGPIRDVQRLLWRRLGIEALRKEDVKLFRQVSRGLSQGLQIPLYIATHSVFIHSPQDVGDRTADKFLQWLSFENTRALRLRYPRFRYLDLDEVKQVLADVAREFAELIRKQTISSEEIASLHVPPSTAPAPPASFKEAFQFFLSAEKMPRDFFERMDPQIQKSFVVKLAKILGKRPDLLTPADFRKDVFQTKTGKTRSLADLFKSYYYDKVPGIDRVLPAGMEEMFEEFLKGLGFEIRPLSLEKAKSIFFGLEDPPHFLWKRSSPQTLRWFVEELAETLGKSPGKLFAHDFLKPVFKTKGKTRSLSSLLLHYQNKTKGQMTPRQATKRLKEELQISDETRPRRKAPPWEYKKDDPARVKVILPEWGPLQRMLNLSRPPDVDPAVFEETRRKAEDALSEEIRQGNSAAVNALRALHFGLVKSFANIVKDKEKKAELENLLELHLMEYIKDYAMRELDKNPQERSTESLRSDLNRRISLMTYIYPRLRSRRFQDFEKERRRKKPLSLDEPLDPSERKPLSRADRIESEDEEIKALESEGLSFEAIERIYIDHAKGPKDLIARNSEILKLRMQGQKLETIGRKFKLSKERVRQIVNKAVKVIQKHLPSDRRAEARKMHSTFDRRNYFTKGEGAKLVRRFQDEVNQWIQNPVIKKRLDPVSRLRDGFLPDLKHWIDLPSAEAAEAVQAGILLHYDTPDTTRGISAIRARFGLPAQANEKIAFLYLKGAVDLGFLAATPEILEAYQGAAAGVVIPQAYDSILESVRKDLRPGQKLLDADKISDVLAELATLKLGRVFIFKGKDEYVSASLIREFEKRYGVKLETRLVTQADLEWIESSDPSLSERIASLREAVAALGVSA